MSLCLLPVELLQLICTHLDSPSLCSLSKASRHLHYTVLPIFLDASPIPKPAHAEFRLWDMTGISSAALKQGLWAIHAALFINDVEKYCLNLPRRLEDGLLCLRAFRWIVKDMQKDCTSFELYFYDFERSWFKFGGRFFRRVDPTPESPQDHFVRSREGGQGIEVRLWRDRVLSLLEEVVKKGCQRLTMQGDEEVADMYSDSAEEMLEESIASRYGIPVEATRKPSRLSKLFDILSSDSNDSKPGLYHPPTPLQQLDPWPLVNLPNNRLESFDLSSTMMFLPPFRIWTVHLLNNSPHLTTLTLEASFYRPASCANFLSALNIPTLTNLSLRCIDTRSEVIADFLERHSQTLQELTLWRWYTHAYTTAATRAASHHDQFQSSGGFGGESPYQVTFPKLEILRVNPIYLLWMMDGTFTNADVKQLKTTSWRSKLSPIVSVDPVSPPKPPLAIRFPSLQEAMIIMDGHPNSTGTDSHYIIQGLERLLNLTTSFSSTSPPLPCPLTTLSFRSCHPSSFERFIRQHIPPGDQTSKDTKTLAFGPHALNAMIPPTGSAPLLGLVSKFYGVKTVRVGANRENVFSPKFVRILLEFAAWFPSAEFLEITEHALGMWKWEKTYGGTIFWSDGMWRKALR